MVRQHIENLFRRYKGKRVVARSTSGNEYEGQVGEITNDYVLLTDGESETFILYWCLVGLICVGALGCVYVSGALMLGAGFIFGDIDYNEAQQQTAQSKAAVLPAFVLSRSALRWLCFF
jgi:hypothetical protein